MTDDGQQLDTTVTVFCVGCADVVSATERCPTCGTVNSSQRALDGAAVLDEALLDRVAAVLAAQAALAHRTAIERGENAAGLYRAIVVLSGRLRRRSALLRARVAEHKELVTAIDKALARVDDTLARSGLDQDNGERRDMAVCLPRDPTCSGIARRLLEAFACGDLGDIERADARLIVSELASNAFLHGEGSIVLNLTRAANRLRIEVLDEGHPDQIRVMPRDDAADTGRGLWIVEQLSSDWGAIAGTGRVWAELVVC